MFLWLAFVSPLTYLSMKERARLRHQILLGKSDDCLIRLFYPL